MCRRILSLAVLAAMVAPGTHATASPGAAPGPGEARVRCLYNCVEFIEWPAAAFAGADTPVVVGVIGKDPFGADLDRLQQKTVNGRRLQIKRFKGALEFRGEETPGRRQTDLPARQARKVAELKSCHILFISSSEKNFMPLILKPLKGASVLTMSDSDGFAREGGMIRFFDDGDRVQMEINLEAANKAGLKISSKLLSLAKVIRDGASADKR